MRPTFLTLVLCSVLSMGMGLECFAGETYLFVADIPGSGTTPQHKGWLPLKNYSWGAERPLSDSATGTARTRAGANFKELTFEMNMDGSFPKLAMALALGTHIPQIILHEVHPTTKRPILEIKLEGSRVKSLNLEGTAATPVVKAQVVYTKIEWTYSVFSPKDARPVGTVTGQWNLGTN